MKEIEDKSGICLKIEKINDLGHYKMGDQIFNLKLEQETSRILSKTKFFNLFLVEVHNNPFSTGAGSHYSSTMHADFLEFLIDQGYLDAQQQQIL